MREEQAERQSKSSTEAQVKEELYRNKQELLFQIEEL